MRVKVPERGIIESDIRTRAGVQQDRYARCGKMHKRKMRYEADTRCKTFDAARYITAQIPMIRG